MREKLLAAAENSLPTDSQPIPREIQDALQRAFTARQLAVLAVKAHELKQTGFGKLIISFAKSRARFIEKSESEELE